jgi:hypothetical protein
MHGFKERKGKKRQLVTGMRESRQRKNVGNEGSTKLGKIQWSKVPVSDQQPSPWSRSEALDQFYKSFLKIKSLPF